MERNAVFTYAPGDLPPGVAQPRRPITERIASWSAKYRKSVLLGWFLMVAGAILVGNLVGSKTVNSYDPGEAGRAEHVLARPGVVQRPTETVLIQARSGRTFASDPELRQAVRQVAAALSRLPRVALDVRSPGGSGGPISGGLISRDGRSALVTFTVAGNPSNADKTVAGAERAVAAVQAEHPDLLVGEAGQASVERATNNIADRDLSRAGLTSLPVTLVLLLIVFGALIAAGIPLLLAGTSVVTAVSLLAIPSHWLPVTGPESSIVLLIGMAVGVDYSLFYLRREREERARGRDQVQALRIAAATSGRAIAVSGITVMTSLAGLFLIGVDIFTGLAIGTTLVVGVAVLGSLTALPAALALLRSWVDRGRVPFLGRRRTTASRSRLWEGLVRQVVKRPVLTGGAAALALAALAIPVLGMRLSSPFIDLPTSLPVVKSLVATQRAFPGGPAPAEIVVTGNDLTGPAVQHAVVSLRHLAATTPGLGEPVTTAFLGHGQVLVVSVPLAGSGTDTKSYRALATLRDRALPATLGSVRGISYAVTGNTAGNHDFTARLDGRAPLVFLFVLGLAFLLLMITFSSITIPLMSIVLNLLSVGAGYGVMTLVFQDGHLHNLLGFTPYGGIIPYLPLFMFVILFGLSMDYHVFILSRIRELRSAGATTTEAIVNGISSSAGVVTSAAVIMVSVFAIFATLSFIALKMFGLGMATAILIDATVVRGVLVPAAMTLLGERNWYLPRWLSFLNRRSPIGAAGPAPAVAATVTAEPRSLVADVTR
ncbi:MAG TPA: MMPL family transporter [Streptosporangiaceae bacterium]|nr:MMPL family transporter [Streptosporangiaceae bacterium]